jgi:vacuolar-type H+-ATPase subunit H
MALEAIAAVEEAEAAAVRRKTEAAQQARRLTVLAQGEGEQLLEETKKKISAQLQQLDSDAEARIRTERDRVRGETESELSILRARAESRLDQAAEKIMERIVSG